VARATGRVADAASSSALANGTLYADSQRSEAALARYMEQARFGAIRGMIWRSGKFPDLLQPNQLLHYRPAGSRSELGSGISRNGQYFLFSPALRPVNMACKPCQ